MAAWFEGVGEIDCSLDTVASDLDDLGRHYVGVIGLMPGMTAVELVDQGSDSVTIKTNEGLMTRTNIVKRIDANIVVVEFDEHYEAGSKVTATTHFADQFTSNGKGVSHRLIMSDVEAPGFLGWFYRRFGGNKMGNAFLGAYKRYFEQTQG